MPEDLFLQIPWSYRTQILVTITSEPHHLSQLWKNLSNFSPNKIGWDPLQYHFSIRNLEFPDIVSHKLSAPLVLNGRFVSPTFV